MNAIQIFPVDQQISLDCSSRVFFDEKSVEIGLSELNDARVISIELEIEINRHKIRYTIQNKTEIKLLREFIDDLMLNYFNSNAIWTKHHDKLCNLSCMKEIARKFTEIFNDQALLYFYSIAEKGTVAATLTYKSGSFLASESAAHALYSIMAVGIVKSFIKEQ